MQGAIAGSRREARSRSAGTEGKGPPSARPNSPPLNSTFQPPTPSFQSPISNRYTKLLETKLNQRKQKTGTRSNRDKTRLFFAAFLPPVFQSQAPQNSKRRAINDTRPNRFLLRLEMHPALYFVRVSEILNEPLFRSEMRSRANRNRKHNQQLARLKS
jgi:hypothetical protein